MVSPPSRWGAHPLPCGASSNYNGMEGDTIQKVYVFIYIYIYNMYDIYIYIYNMYNIYIYIILYKFLDGETVEPFVFVFFLTFLTVLGNDLGQVCRCLNSQNVHSSRCQGTPKFSLTQWSSYTTMWGPQDS